MSDRVCLLTQCHFVESKGNVCLVLDGFPFIVGGKTRTLFGSHRLDHQSRAFTETGAIKATQMAHNSKLKTGAIKATQMAHRSKLLFSTHDLWLADLPSQRCIGQRQLSPVTVQQMWEGFLPRCTNKYVHEKEVES